MFTLRKWKTPHFRNESQGGPPDFEELLRKMRIQALRFFSSKPNKTNQAKQPGHRPFSLGVGGFGVALISLVVLVLWFLSGIFIVSPAEQAAVLYFGRYSKTLGPGPHWIPRFIANRYTVNVQQIANFPYQAEMLTKDENIVSVDIAVQYRIDDVKNYLFNVVDASESLQQATASALRQTVGQTTLDEILTTGRAKVRDQVNQQIKKILSLYQPGLLVTDVTLQPVKPPEQVTEAFDDAIKAREDEQRYINQAQAYSNRVMATAQGEVSRIIQNAAAQKQKTILLAEGETAGFLELLPQYQRSPQIMSKRMYFEAMEFILSRTSKILMDSKAGQQVFYLPLDKLVASQGAKDEVSPVPLPNQDVEPSKLPVSSRRVLGQALPTAGYGFEKKEGNYADGE